MAIKLYREGTTHNINGVQCEIRLFTGRDPLSFVGIDGWCKSLDDVNKTDFGDVNNADSDEWEGYTSEQVRELAKDADIDGWDTKRINTLKEVLSGESTQG
jgi:hypothetical protein